MFSSTASSGRSPKQAALWYGGNALHAVYRAKIPGVSPWAKQQLSRRSYARDLVPIPELAQTFGVAVDWLLDAHDNELAGSYLEFGVCTGSSMIALKQALETRAEAAIEFVGFDSFEGLPSDAPDQDDGVWKAGSFMSDYDRTQRRLVSHGIDARLVVGWFGDTLHDDTRSSLGLESAPLIMVDCDIYTATVEALDFVFPHITGPTVIVFDDWFSCGLADKNLGEARAWREFLIKHPEIREVAEFPAYNGNSRVIAVDLT